jgi:hypothetical protein
MGKIFKCYSELDTPENMLFLDEKYIIKISPRTMQDGRNKLFVEHYDDEFCIETLLICEEIVTIDPDIDEDYKIWLNS